jgi:atypical dual specificity phosphatase
MKFSFGSVGNNLMDRFALASPQWAVRLAGYALFWPIAGFQFCLYRLGFFPWYSEVYRSPNGGRVILGGLPWPESTREKLVGREGVTSVINLVSERQFPFKVERRLDIPLTDFSHPEFKDIAPAVDFLQGRVDRGETVYVHCRAGKGRSATVVMCWLVEKLGMEPIVAQQYLLSKRPVVLDNLHTREVVKEFDTKRILSQKKQ